MSELELALLMLLLSCLILFIIFFICRFIGLWQWTTTWVCSSGEEKMNLTRSKGHYNANGYFVPSDSMGEINLCYSGSFKRFDTVDHDYRIAMTTFAPQPLEQASNYPEHVSVPYGRVQYSKRSDFAVASSSRSGMYHYFSDEDNTPELNMSEQFITTASIEVPPSSAGGTASEIIPPQPLRPAPAPPPSHIIIYEKSSVPPKRPPPPFRYAVPPPIPPRTKPPRQEPAIPKIRPQILMESDEVMNQVQGLRRAVSCESICSDTSVGLADLEEPHVTGYLCIGLDYDSECADLAVSILEAKDLTGPDPDDDTPMDTFVRVYLLPDKNVSIQTRVYRKSNSPSYKEKFLFTLEPRDFLRRSLSFYIYCANRDSEFLIGEGDLRLCDISVRHGITTWITLTDTGQNRTEWGELMLSLSYLPTAERLTVVVVKARNLVFPRRRESGDPFVKVYILKQGKKIYKKKTSIKKGERSPIFNEAMIFNVPATSLQNLQLRVTVAESIGEPKAYPLGHVILGSQASGKALSHWLQMLSSLRISCVSVCICVNVITLSVSILISRPTLTVIKKAHET